MAVHKQKSLTPPPLSNVESERDARLIAATALSAMKSGSSLKQNESGTSVGGLVETKSVPAMASSRGGVFADNLFSEPTASVFSSASSTSTPEKFIPLEGTSSCISGPTFPMDTPRFNQRTVECIKGENLFPVAESTEESWTPLPYKQIPHDGTMYAV